MFGQSFTPAGVAALSERPQQDVTEILDGLVAKQVLGFNDDRLSSERGQYHFLQGLLRTTAYGTLSRRDRKSRHLAAARHLQEAWGDEAPELAEVLAAHFLDAAAADPDAADAPRIRAAACETLADAGQRALRSRSGGEAQRSFDHAAELAEDEHRRAELLDRAARAAQLNADQESAKRTPRTCGRSVRALGDRAAAARSLAALAQSLFWEHQLGEAIELLRRAVVALPQRTAEQAGALAELSRFLAFRNEFSEAVQTADEALSIAEPLQDWSTVVRAFNTMAQVRVRNGRIEESMAFRERALKLALAHDLTEHALRTYNNLADGPLQLDRFQEARDLAEPGLALAQARGDRSWEQVLRLMIAAASLGLGRWDDTLEAERANTSELLQLAYLPQIARIHAARGDKASLHHAYELAVNAGTSTNAEFDYGSTVARAIVLNATGKHREALDAALPIATAGSEIANEDRREAYVEAGMAALALDDEETVERLISTVQELAPAMRSPLLRASAARFEGRLAQRHGDLDKADERLAAAARELRAIDAPFALGQLLLDHAEVLYAAGRNDDSARLTAEAVTIFERLRATPWLARAQALGTQVVA